MYALSCSHRHSSSSSFSSLLFCSRAKWCDMQTYPWPCIQQQIVCNCLCFCFNCFVDAIALYCPFGLFIILPSHTLYLKLNKKVIQKKLNLNILFRDAHTHYWTHSLHIVVVFFMNHVLLNKMLLLGLIWSLQQIMFRKCSK